ncbi:hypothetical protein [Actinopolyspora halophila]|uniref:hypothetical protein n=1 Tax=Actinopolyspora halophila TaxID=1850 RepID=UPI0003675431|nr:hypothetical protein [Actinopolyspora halophila]
MLLFLVLVFSPVVTALVVLVVLVHSALSYRRLLRRPARLCSYAAVLLLGFAHLVFSWALTHIPVVAGMSRCMEVRPEGMNDDVRLTRYDPRTFPPEANCVWDDGATVDLVPEHVTSVVYVLGALALGCVIAALYFLLRGSRSRADRS